MRHARTGPTAVRPARAGMLVRPWRCALLAATIAGCAGPPPSGPAPCPPPPDPAVLARTAQPAPAAGDAARGAQLFQRECARCHSPLREDRESRFFGDYPRLDCPAYRDRVSPGYLRTAIAEGGAAVGREDVMKPFAETLDEQQIADLVAFLLGEL